mgnify:CR=1 FL=1
MSESLEISVEEAAKLMHRGRSYIINAVVQGTMPGCYTISKNGRRNVFIPRKAFMKFLEDWNRSPSDALIDELYKAYVNKK